MKIDVVVDTLGKADMKTFKVVTVSSPWLADQREERHRQVDVLAGAARRLQSAARLPFHVLAAPRAEIR